METTHVGSDNIGLFRCGWSYAIIRRRQSSPIGSRADANEWTWIADNIIRQQVFVWRGEMICANRKRGIGTVVDGQTVPFLSVRTNIRINYIPQTTWDNFRSKIRTLSEIRMMGASVASVQSQSALPSWQIEDRTLPVHCRDWPSQENAIQNHSTSRPSTM